MLSLNISLYHSMLCSSNHVGDCGNEELNFYKNLQGNKGQFDDWEVKWFPLYRYVVHRINNMLKKGK